MAQKLIDAFVASVDYETDKKIQDTIATEFQDRTILCIARECFRGLRRCIYLMVGPPPQQIDCRPSSVTTGSVSWTLGASQSLIPLRSCTTWKTVSSVACATAPISRSKISTGQPRAAARYKWTFPRIEILLYRLFNRLPSHVPSLYYFEVLVQAFTHFRFTPSTN